MMCATLSNVSYAEETPDKVASFEANDYYTFIVSVKTGKAIQAPEANDAAVTADADIPGNNGNNLQDNALFQMKKIRQITYSLVFLPKEKKEEC